MQLQPIAVGSDPVGSVPGYSVPVGSVPGSSVPLGSDLVPVGSVPGGSVPMFSVPLGSLIVGPLSWRDQTLRSVRRAERLVRQSRAGRSAARSPARSCSAAGSSPQGPAGGGRTRPQSTGTTLPTDSRGCGLWGGRLPPPGLRERCAGLSSAVAAGYMRGVREVEVRLRQQAGWVSEEGVKLQREGGHLDRMLRNIRTQRGVNRRSSAWRRSRPASAETDRDVADKLLLWESRELSWLEERLKGALSDTWTQLQALGASSQQLLDCASERARVLELLPPRSSARPPRDSAGPPTGPETDPLSPFTPECQRVLEAASRTVGQSQRLREDLRRLLSSATARQDAAHRSVNDGLVKKIAETTNLQQTLSVTSAAARQAMFRKQREVDFIRNSHDSAQGPESTADMFSREKLTRPLVQVYHRHPGTELPEAAQLIQGCAALRRRLRTSQGEVERLQRAGSGLLADLYGKTTAAQVDAAVLRMRRQQVDRRAVPSFLQRGVL